MPPEPSGPSFHSAIEPRDIFSSSISPPPPSSSGLGADKAPPLIRALPDELVQQITIYFEEELYHQGITFLSNILASGTNSRGPIFIPPPFHLSLILTLSIHPRFTIHALTNEKLRVSAAATTYLSALLSTVGPISGGFAQAYAFNNHAYMRGGRRKVTQRSADNSDDSSVEPLESDLAKNQGFFKRADDFWSALGWAFNCSVLHARRWESWTLWCSHFIDLLEQDWRMHESQNKGNKNRWTHKTLLGQYIGETDKYKVKRIVRAVFSEGTGPEFTEIWKDETLRKRKKAPNYAPRIKLDIEAGQLGDYAAQSSSEEENVSDDGEPKTEISQLFVLGGPEALTFRARLLALLSSYSLADPDHFISIDSLFNEYLSHLRPLPLQTFHAFLNPKNLSYFPPDLACELIQYLAQSFQEPGIPEVSPGETDWTLIEKQYAPWASSGQTGASTVGDNGKLGVCVELLVSLTRRRLGFSPLLGVSVQDATNGTAKTDAHRLWAHLEKGCKRRQERAGSNVRRAKKGEAGAEFDFEQARDFEVALLKGARLRLALLLGMKI